MWEFGREYRGKRTIRNRLTAEFAGTLLPAKPPMHMMALEPRIVLDAALADTVAEVKIGKKWVPYRE